jgi:hypothetical protein
MADTNPCQQTASEAHGPESTVHAYDAPNISAKEFLLRVMHDPDAPIKDRIRAASSLLRLFPHDWDPPSAKIVIGGIPEHCGSSSTSSDPGATDERLGNSSHSREIDHKGPTRMTENPQPPNIETIIEDIRSGNFPEPTLCTICGHYMPYPCSTTKN